MRDTHYDLRPRSHSCKENQLLGFDMTAEVRGKPLGGRNVQLTLGAESEQEFRRWRRWTDDPVAIRLTSGWWVRFRNEFATQPQVAERIVASVAKELTAITVEAATVEDDVLWPRLRETMFEATGPDYWR